MDQNFIRQEIAEEGATAWYDAKEFKIYGLIPDEYLGRRLPLEVARQVNDGVANYSACSAGGRIRFSTDSPYVALKAIYGEGSVPTVNNHCVSYGFDLYRDTPAGSVFVNAARPAAGFDRKTGEYKMLTRSNGVMTDYTLNFPIFCQVIGLQIGVEKGSKVSFTGAAYRNEKPVVYYGSSITHGAAAGRPGNTYESFISQQYNLDYVNLGFAGSARGEQTMAEYIAGLSMSVFVCDYDHNAPTVEHLKQTHYPFYQTIRRKQPDLPYIMVSRPTFFMRPEINGQRRDVIRQSYEKAKSSGDQNVFFIDGETLMAGPFMESCTSDGIHPNDLGFFRMAQGIGPVVEQVYKLTK